MRNEEITKLLEDLNNPDAFHNPLFGQIVARAIALVFMNSSKFLEEFQVAESTVLRWVSGVAFPVPQIRGQVLAFIKNKAEELNEFKK